MNDISVDEFIRKNYRPVDDKPGYVWLNSRRFEIISVANLAASLESYWKKGIKNQTTIDKLCVNPGYILSKEEIIKAMEEKKDGT